MLRSQVAQPQNVSFYNTTLVTGSTVLQCMILKRLHGKFTIILNILNTRYHLVSIVLEVPSFITLKTGGSAVISCGNNDRTLSTSNRNRQSLSSDRAGDVGVDNGVLAASVGGTTGICNGGRTGGEEEGCSVTTSTPGR